jgi:hypothetical protein
MAYRDHKKEGFGHDYQGRTQANSTHNMAYFVLSIPS